MIQITLKFITREMYEQYLEIHGKSALMSEISFFFISQRVKKQHCSLCKVIVHAICGFMTRGSTSRCLKSYRPSTLSLSFDRTIMFQQLKTSWRYTEAQRIVIESSRISSLI